MHICISKLNTIGSDNGLASQALDQLTNSPFIGQLVGNCKSFTLTHYLADLFAMHRGPRSIPLCIQHHIQLTSLSFQVSRPSHSWDTEISLLLWKSKVKVMCEVKVGTHNVSLATSYQLTSLFFHVNAPLPPFLRYSIFKISPWKSKVKVSAEGHIV